MSSSALTPRVRMMAVCDGIHESKTEDSVFNLKGVRQAIAAHAFPFVPARLWLFVLLSIPRAGEYPGYVRVVNEKNRSDRILQLPRFSPNVRISGQLIGVSCAASLRVFGSGAVFCPSVVFSRRRQ